MMGRPHFDLAASPNLCDRRAPMKTTFIFLLPLAFLTGCAETQPMPRDPYVGRKIEQIDGNRGDVPSVNHPNLDPNRGYDGPSGGYYGRDGRGGYYGHDYYGHRNSGYYYR